MLIVLPPYADKNRTLFIDVFMGHIYGKNAQLELKDKPSHHLVINFRLISITSMVFITIQAGLILGVYSARYPHTMPFLIFFWHIYIAKTLNLHVV